MSDRFAVWIRSPLGHSLLALLLGMLSVMGFAPHNIPEAVLLSVMGLLGLLAQSHHWKQGAWIGGFYGLGLFGFGMNWLGISLTVYGGVPFGFGWLMVLGLAVILASFIALFAGIAVYLKRSVALWFWAIFLIPSLWTLNEWLRVILWDGFPWLLFAYSHVDTWLVSWAQMGGNLAVTFVVMMSAGILWWLWISGQWLTGGLAFACLWGISWQLQSVSWVSPKGDAVPVALLHTQISERLKWQASQQDGFIEAQIQASQRVLTEHPNVKLIVWPETAIPTFIDSVQEQLLPLQTKALSRGVTVLAGTAIREAHLDGKQYFNSISTLDGQTHYDKRHLVPFSEYYPAFGVLNALASFIGMPMAQFSEGQSARMMQLGHQQVGLGVCYEADFLHELVAINSTTDWWLIVSDDGWFYPSWMAEQHWQIVRLHAIALGRDIARVTNLGITGVAQANGANQIVANPIDVMEAKIVKVQSYQGDTFYGQWQDMPILGIISFILALALMRQKRRIV